ncbi:hypothetical protein AJ87_36460 [Rhizobium yanglingense]|nr:hypothetical protein AJ87_36460 [Rhizobium yanglingense]
MGFAAILDETRRRPPPINARREGIATNGLFKSAYRSKRCLVPINGFFEWKDIFGTGKNKQPYAIAMTDDSPFALAGIWDTWRDPATGAEVRSALATLTTVDGETTQRSAREWAVPNATISG